MKARAAKTAPTGANPRTPIPITTALNISALAREHGVSRKTIQRRLAKGWRPAAEPHARTPSAPVRAPLGVPDAARGGYPAPCVGGTRTHSARPPVDAHLRPPLGVVRTVLLILAVAFYVFVACAAVGVRG